MNDTPATVPSPALSGEAAIAPVQAVIGTFSSPSETFRRLVAKPTWWLPLVIWVVVSLSGFLSSMPKVDWETSARQALEKQAEKSGRTPPPEAVPRVVSFMKISSYIGAPVFIVGAAFLVPLVLWSAARMFGGDLKYSQATSLWLHANLANCAKGLVAIPLVLSTADGSLNLQNLDQTLKSNVGAFLPDGTPAFVVAFASWFDVFSLFALVLLVIGFRRIPSLSKGAATAIPVILWAIAVAISTGLATLRA